MWWLLKSHLIKIYTVCPLSLNSQYDCLVSVKQGNFIYMPVLSTICVAVCAQESIPANTKHCNDVFGMYKTFYGRFQDALAMLYVGRDVNIFHMIACCII